MIKSLFSVLLFSACLVASSAFGSLDPNPVYSARIANNGTTASITAQRGSWISSVSRSAAGDVVVNITSGIFAVAPSCVCTPETTGRACGFNATPTTSAVEPYVVITSTGAANDQNFSIHCQMPR